MTYINKIKGKRRQSVMELEEIVRKINSKEIQKKDIAKEMGINPSTLQRRMKKEGYNFDKEADL
ncbi:hypothetical protein J7E66_25915, partial [Bacillus sp. ISL-7]|nr:hypothetical protein [Bacillus sp. ISL-7]